MGSSSSSKCPRCNGYGWIDAFDKGCKQGSFHCKCPCRLCGGTGRMEDCSQWTWCQECRGLGGHGSLGPCGEYSIHFRALCRQCDGKGWNHISPTAPPSSTQPMSQPSCPPQMNPTTPSMMNQIHARGGYPHQASLLVGSSHEQPAIVPTMNPAPPLNVLAANHQVLATQNPTNPPIVPADVNQALAPSAPPMEQQNCENLGSAQNAQGLLSPQTEESFDCVICMSTRKDTVISPCGHLCVCNTCAQVLLAGEDACPICRGTIASVMRVYQ
eukprot:gnl/MRDRNA2_/MRDRNA2_152094_c0_seq1.p1 gnl/MRDRNA2_/MRDRNA2_152094_c0~~gnl/MRDRNA2_/MRDRNA2_152094_c0_seq1.p1  ORF type:complete len:271 (-),score=27.44 gnl/MRDRNA2_/MRDRNA2_152094_c0_seq1:229-1041(-)